jgi:hypothetical protein
MGVTRTTQLALPPSAGAYQTEEGDGLHTLFAKDLVKGLNNLGSYVTGNRTCFVAGSDNAFGTISLLLGTGVTATTEFYAGQHPVIMPRGNPTRMLWTAGARATGDTGTAQAAEVSAVTVYLANRPYTGVGPASPALTAQAFDATNLGTLGYNYVKRSKAATITDAAGTSGVYGLYDDSAVGLVAPFPDPILEGFDQILYLIYTLSCKGGAAHAVRVALQECTSWWNYDS